MKLSSHSQPWAVASSFTHATNFVDNDQKLLTRADARMQVQSLFSSPSHSIQSFYPLGKVWQNRIINCMSYKQTNRTNTGPNRLGITPLYDSRKVSLHFMYSGQHWALLQLFVIIRCWTTTILQVFNVIIRMLCLKPTDIYWLPTVQICRHAIPNALHESGKFAMLYQLYQRSQYIIASVIC